MHDGAASSALHTPVQPTCDAHLRVTVTPEVATDEVVSSLRSSWMRNAGDDARFCVAAGMSKSHDASLHWLHGLNRSSTVASGREDLNLRLNARGQPDATNVSSTASLATVPARSAAAMVAAAAAAEAQQQKTDLAARTKELTRVYNNFLRHKVFEIMRDMCRALPKRSFNFAFMMDADTAVNRSNLERFVSGIELTVPVYTGLCKRRSTWSNQMQRGVGGGPGILLSRPLLEATCPRLEQCAPLRLMMDRLHFAGGDLMLAKCMEFLGHRCNLEKEIPCALAARTLPSVPSPRWCGLLKRWRHDAFCIAGTRQLRPTVQCSSLEAGRGATHGLTRSFVAARRGSTPL